MPAEPRERQIVTDGGRGRLHALVELADGADVGEQRGLDAVLLGQEVRERQFRGHDGVELAAQRLVIGRIARADARGLEAAEGRAALEEAVVDADRVAAEGQDVARLPGERAHDARREAVVERARHLGADVLHVAAHAPPDPGWRRSRNRAWRGSGRSACRSSACSRPPNRGCWPRWAQIDSEVVPASQFASSTTTRSLCSW